MTGDSSDPIL